MNILVIPDTQVKPNQKKWKHLEALGQFILDRKPDVIVHIGDHWDMPSLSAYDMGLKAEGKDVGSDIKAGNKAMDVMLKPMREYNNKQRATKHKQYKPEMHFLIGNHEERIARHVNEHPELRDFLGYKSLNFGEFKVHDFLQVIEIEGIKFSHYFYNPLSGRPIGGAMQNRLNKIQCSFVQGHEQSFHYGRAHTIGGEHVGLVAGAFYEHDEEYKGPQGNDHWRGIVMLNNAANGDYDLETIRLETLKEEYA